MQKIENSQRKQKNRSGKS